MESVGERLKKIRKENNYTQDMLADKLKLEPAAISKYETNRVPIPQEYIIKICDLFNISTDYLLGRTDEQNTVKEIDKNTSISYGRKFISQAKMKVATVSIGYADGIRRALSNVGNVVIKGQKVPIIGTICMDSFMVDVTDIDCQEGDQVYIFDNEIITLDEIAKQCNTINYEILSTISERVPRVFKN